MSAAGARQFVEAFDSVDQKLTKLMPFQQAKEWQKSYISDLIQEMVDSGQTFTRRSSNAAMRLTRYRIISAYRV